MKALRRPRRRFGVRVLLEGDTITELSRAASALLEFFRKGPLGRRSFHGEGFDAFVTNVRDTVQQTDTRYQKEKAAYLAERASIPRAALCAEGRFRRRRKRKAERVRVGRAPRLAPVVASRFDDDGDP